MVKDADDTINLVKNTNLHTSIVDIEKKIPNNDIYITTQEFNKLTTDNFTVRLIQGHLVRINDTADFLKRV